jgi:hypothetical protein
MLAGCGINQKIHTELVHYENLTYKALCVNFKNHKGKRNVYCHGIFSPECLKLGDFLGKHFSVIHSTMPKSTSKS